jgi:hypothetical protein
VADELLLIQGQKVAPLDAAFIKVPVDVEALGRASAVEKSMRTSVRPRKPHVVAQAAPAAPAQAAAG